MTRTTCEMAMIQHPRMIHRRCGAVLPMLAVMLMILFVVAALSVDIARMHLTRAELRSATDAAARAATEALARTQDEQEAIDAALAIANQNVVAGVPLTLSLPNISVGQVTTDEAGQFVFSPTAPPDQLNAVRVIGDRSANSPDGAVGMLFAPLFGVVDFEPVQTATANRVDRDIALVLDISGSMADFNRFTELQSALDTFLNEMDATLAEERVSLIVYNSTATTLVPLTTNMDAIRVAFSNQSPNGNTAIGEGINRGLSSVLYDPNARPFANKSILVMTDGNHNTGISPVTAALSCEANNIVVNAVTFGPDADQALMQQTATTGSGMYLHADTGADLSSAFQQIARQIPVILVE